MNRTKRNVGRRTLNPERIERRTLNVELPTLQEGGSTSKVYDPEERLLEFAANVVRFVERLPSTRAGNHVANQLLKSGTSPLPHHAEAQAAESRDDFVHQFKICLKELRETLRWLKLVKRVPLLQRPSQVDELLNETEALVKIFVTSIRTAGQRRGIGAIRSSKLDVEHSTFESFGREDQ